MKINISYKLITPDEPLKVFVQEKIGSLERLLKEDARIGIEIGKSSKHHRKGEVFYAEGNVTLGKVLLRAQAEHHDLRAAIVDVKEDLAAQLKKLKDKKVTQRKTAVRR